MGFYFLLAPGDPNGGPFLWLNTVVSSLSLPYFVAGLLGWGLKGCGICKTQLSPNLISDSALFLVGTLPSRPDQQSRLRTSDRERTEAGEPEVEKTPYSTTVLYVGSPLSLQVQFRGRYPTRNLQ